MSFLYLFILGLKSLFIWLGILLKVYFQKCTSHGPPLLYSAHMFPKPNSLEILPGWYVSFQTWHACGENMGTDGLSLGPVSLAVPLQTANMWDTEMNYERGDLKIMRYFIFNEILGLVLQVMLSSTAFPRAVLETHCIWNENWDCPSCFPCKGLGREVSAAKAHSLQENLGDFFLLSKRHIEHQGNNKNQAEEQGKTRGSDRDRGTEYIQEILNIFNSFPHPRAQGPLISLAVLFCSSVQIE